MRLVDRLRLEDGQVPQIRIDKAKCQGHALCYGVDPELFPLDEDGFSALTTLTIPEKDKATALRGVMACPERAIEVVD